MPHRGKKITGTRSLKRKSFYGNSGKKINPGSMVYRNKRLHKNYTTLYREKNYINCERTPNIPICKKVNRNDELYTICSDCWPSLNCCWDEILTA